MSTKSYPNSKTMYSTVIHEFADGSSTQTGPTVRKLSWTDSVTYGENIPDWRRMLREGQNATTSLVGNRTEVRYQPGYFKAKSNFDPKRTISVDGYCQLVPTDPAGLSNPSSIDEARSNAEALGRFAKRILSARAAIQGGVVVGELGQTLRMIRNPAQGLRGLIDLSYDTLRDIRAARRLGTLKQHMRAVSENLADAWLELSFGWKPFLSDIKDGADALIRTDIGRSLQTRRITSSSKDSGSPVEVTTLTGNSFLGWQLCNRQVSHSMVIYRGAVRLEAIDPRTFDPALFGFSPEQFLPTAWELLPWSFLIDYFVNIDDVLAGWSTLLTDLAWANKTTRKWVEETCVASYDQKIQDAWSANRTVVSQGQAKVITTKTSVVRAKYTGDFTPGLTFTIPGLGDRKWLNIAALLANRNGDRKWFYD